MKDQTILLRRGIRNLTRVVAILSALPTDIDIEVKVSQVKKERSNPQNSALYGVAYKALGEFTGYTAPELHEVMLRAYFGEVTREVMGKTITTARRTTTTDENGKRSLLSTIEFCAYYAFVQQKAAEIGCWIDDPDPSLIDWRNSNAA